MSLAINFHPKLLVVSLMKMGSGLVNKTKHKWMAEMNS